MRAISRRTVLMRNYPRTLKRKILETISQQRDELPRYTQDSKRDFTRKRKLPFETLCRTILSMSGQSLNVELQRQFHYEPAAATASASFSSEGSFTHQSLKTFCAVLHSGTVPNNGGTGTHCWPWTAPMCSSRAISMTRLPTSTAQRTDAAITCCT